MSRRKKKADRTEKAKDSEQAHRLPDRRLTDQTMAGIQALLAEQNFETIEEANAYLQELLQGGRIPPPPSETPLQKAQAVMYEAFEAHGRERVRLAKNALRISPDCADAYVLLAEEEARTLEKANDYYAQGVYAGRRALGPEMFREHEGRFWGIVETRPFMRAMHGYAQTLWWLGDRKTSVAIQQEMLRLNPGDNQGVRYFLTHCLLEMLHLDELEELFTKYPEDVSAEFIYPRALAAFINHGASIRADQSLREAVEANPYVPAYLLGEKELPDEQPDYHGLGDESEAAHYVSTYGVFWTYTDGALEWLRTMLSQQSLAFDDLDPEFDVDEEWEEYDSFPPFRLAEFLADGNFPKSEHGSVRRCMAVGLGKYFFDIYGYYEHGKQPVDLIDEWMHVPYVYGYGAVEVIRHKRVRPASKLQVCRHAVEILDIGVEGGIPYGMLTLLGYMASQGVLDYGLLQLTAVGLRFGNRTSLAGLDWLEGAGRDEMLSLIDWIAANNELSTDERLWWAWRTGVESRHSPHIGKVMALRWLSLEALTPGDKLALCHGWLEKENGVGTPPLLWQINHAMRTGRFSELRKLIRERDVYVPPEIEEVLDQAAQEEAHREPDSFQGFLFEMADWVMTPHFLYRLAVPALVRFGEDIETTIETYWESDSSFSDPARTAGVADTIQEFSSQLPPERLRELVERGINHNLAQTRKTFYMLSEEYYGDEYLRLALQDNAASLRKWAAKKLEKRG